LEEEEEAEEAVVPKKRDSFMGKIRMGKLSRGKPKKSENLWGKSTFQGKEKGLSKQKGLMGPLTRRGEDLWGES